MPQVYDCFMFNGEWDLLELRLHTHNSAVNWFVITESNNSHRGASKRLHFDINDPRVQQFSRKIRYILVSDMPNDEDPWQNEHHQRNAITRGLWDSQPDDLIIVSDCDELVKPEYIQQAAAQIDFDIFGFQQPIYYCYFNNRMIGSHADKIWAVAVRARKLKEQTATWYRGNLGAEPYFWYPNAGWHYSYMGDENTIKNKIENFLHQELNTPGLLENLNPRDCALNNRDLFGRSWCEWTVVPPDQLDLPEYAKNNWHKYQKYILDYNEYLKYQAGLAQR